MRIYQKRDLTIMETPAEYIILSCDSTGGIGRKPGDSLQVDPFLVGRYGARVTLMEILSVGAHPLVLINTLCVEMHPTGQRIVEGIQKEAGDMAIITGSSEENMKTIQTGMGITAMGVAQSLKINMCRQGEYIAALGTPSVGTHVLACEHEFLTLHDVKRLRQVSYIGDIIPVGSQGIRRETYHLGSIHFFENPLDMDTSCGPSTVVLVTLPAENIDDLRSEVCQPLHIIGEIREPASD
jgi:hypothetical protein